MSAVKLNPKLPLADAFMARIAAQAIVSCGWDMRAACAELRPDIRCWRAFGAKLLAEPAVRQQIEVIMNRVETKGASAFIALMWQWLTAPANPDDDSVEENRRTAARILAKGYVSEKARAADGKSDAVDKFVTDLGPEVANLTKAQLQ